MSEHEDQGEQSTPKKTLVTCYVCGKHAYAYEQVWAWVGGYRGVCKGECIESCEAMIRLSGAWF